MQSSKQHGSGNDVSPTPPNIPDHQILRCIGRGSYGEVWLARNQMGTYRAVKVVYRRAFQDERPYERESAGIHRFEPISRSHEGFVDVLHFGRNEEEGYFYYVMELADDRNTGATSVPETYVPCTLSGALAKRGRFAFTECVQLGLSLSDALGHLHRHGLVHRDIKPSNIIFVDGAPKLADIGLVASFDEALSYVGTEGFFPPEGPGTAQADIFSLGKVLYEISTGEDRHAFPRLPAEFQDWADQDQFLELNEIILRACQNDVRARYQTAEEMHADLTFILNGKSVKRLRLLERRFAKLKKVALGAAAALAVLALFYYPYRREQILRAESRQRQIGTHLVRGIQDMDNGQLLESLPSFVEALRLDRGPQEHKHRLRIHAVLDQCPKLLRVWQVPDQLQCGEFSLDGSRVVLAGNTAQARVMDAETGEALGPAFGPKLDLTAATFSSDGRLALTAAENSKASLWDWRTGEQLLVLPHPKGVFSAKFSPSGDQILTGCGDQVARLWDARTGKLLVVFQGHTNMVTDGAFSRDQKTIVTVGRDNTARLWDARNGKSLGRPLVHDNWLYHVAFSHDERRVATACFDNRAHVWDLATGQEAVPPLQHHDGVGSVEFSPDGRLILTGCWDGTARLWDAVTGKPATPNPILPHSSRVMHATFHPDGHRILTVCLDGTARLWDLAAASPEVAELPGAVSADGTAFVTIGHESVQAGDVLTQKRFPSIRLPGPLREVGLSRNGRFVLTLCSNAAAGASSGTDLAIWRSESGRRIAALPAFGYSLTHLVVGDEGTQLVAFATNQGRLYDLRTGEPRLPPLVHTGTVQAAVFATGGKKLLTTSRNSAYFWDTQTGKLIWRAQHPSRLKVTQYIRFARLSPDGQLAITCLRDDNLNEGSAQVWDTQNGQPLGPLLSHRDGIFHAAFSPDQRRVVTASEDFTATIWDYLHPGQPKKLQHDHQIRQACFSPGGAWVLTASRDQSARVWDAESEEPLTPPLPHPAALWAGMFLTDHAFLVANSEFFSLSRSKNISWLWRLEPDAHPVEDLTLLAQVLSGKAVAASPGQTAPEAWFAAWQKLKAKYPVDFATTRDELMAWHRRQCTLAKAEKQWAAVAFHCDRLLALHPGNSATLQLRDEALREQAKAKVTLSSPAANEEPAQGMAE